MVSFVQTLPLLLALVSLRDGHGFARSTGSSRKAQSSLKMKASFEEQFYQGAMSASARASVTSSPHGMSWAGNYVYTMQNKPTQIAPGGRIASSSSMQAMPNGQSVGVAEAESQTTISPGTTWQGTSSGYLEFNPKQNPSKTSTPGFVIGAEPGSGSLTTTNKSLGGKHGDQGLTRYPNYGTTAAPRDLTGGAWATHVQEVRRSEAYYSRHEPMDPTGPQETSMEAIANRPVVRGYSFLGRTGGP